MDRKPRRHQYQQTRRFHMRQPFRGLTELHPRNRNQRCVAGQAQTRTLSVDPGDDMAPQVFADPQGQEDRKTKPVKQVAGRQLDLTQRAQQMR